MLRKHYKMPATISAGCFALMVDEAKANVVVYGNEVDGEWMCGPHAFHAWVECDGWLIDFMSPIMNVSLQDDGVGFSVPSRMLQKQLAVGCGSPRHLQRVGDFYAHHDSSLVNTLIDLQEDDFSDLLHVCDVWFCRPPKSMKPLALGGTHSVPRLLQLQAPSIEGVW